MPEEPVIGDWIRECVLGEGGFGVITMWKNAKTENSIAVKKCRWGLDSNLTPRQRERWINEVKIIQQINNTNIIQYLELPDVLKTELLKHNPSGLPLLSMEYCAKGDLRKMLLNPENCCGLLEMDVRYILADLLNGVSYLHSINITHRDLKPENVVLQISDTRPSNIVYKIIDLGYAKEINSNNTCASFVGTLHYLAPEILFGSPYNCSVDYWSLGIVAFEIICGVRPVPQNKAPAQWLMDINNKTTNEICVYEEPNGKIKYSTEIFSENHISTYFKTEIEKWLRLALDFNSQQRGYKQNNTDKSSPDIFTELEALLKKKCITIFSVNTYDFLSYEIDDSTLFSTLQVWYERDTKIAIEDQIWLTKKCKRILPGEDIYAVQCFDETYPSVMIFVFKSGEVMCQREYQPQFPRLAKLIFESNHTQQKLHQLKLCFSHILYFVYQQNKYYNTLLVAWRTMILYLCDNMNEISNKCKNMINDKNILIALKEFSKNCLDYDCQKNAELVDKEMWVKSFNDINSQVSPLTNAVEHIAKRVDSNNRRISELQRIFQQEYSPSVEHDLNLIFDKTLDCYKSSIQKANDNIITSSCRELKKYFIDCLERSEKLLSDIDLQNKLRHISDINIEQQNIIKTINNCLLHITKIKDKLLKNHIKRQSIIWEYLNEDSQNRVETRPNSNGLQNIQIQENTNAEQQSRNKNNLSQYFESEQIYENVECDDIYPELHSGGQTFNSLQDRKSTIKENFTTDSISENKIFYSLPPICTSNKLFNFPASELVDENVALRYKVQEKTNESFLQVKSIMSENLDFTFLNCNP